MIDRTDSTVRIDKCLKDKLHLLKIQNGKNNLQDLIEDMLRVYMENPQKENSDFF